jgi:hypothetical protein
MELRMTSEVEEKTAFEGWAVVELFGHNQIAGYVSEVAVFGTAMMQVDVPAAGDNPGYTKFFGGAAIYAITPTSEEIARVAAQRLDVRPVKNWVVPENKAALPPPAQYEQDEWDDYDD